MSEPKSAPSSSTRADGGPGEATAAEPKEELDFRSTIEALFCEALKDDLTPRLKERLCEEGLDLDRLRPAYPRKVFSRACRIAAEEIFGELSMDEALRAMGRRTMEGFANTILGKAAFGVFRIIGVRRGLERLTRAFRNGDNYTETSFTMVGPAKADVWVSQVNGQPTFTLGMLEAALDWVGAKNAGIAILRQENDGCVYRIWWEDGSRPS